MMRIITAALAMLGVALPLSTTSGAAPGTPQQLRCEGLIDPLGIDRAAPRFSWALAPGGRGLAQTAYQVVVA